VAAARKLGNFVVVVDANGGQNDGLVRDISPLPGIEDRFAAFGFETETADGHDLSVLSRLLAGDRLDRHRPLAIVAQTVKGKGVPPIEGKAASHYVSIDAARAAKWKQLIR
jgi:transketolase